jgi:hypothetical protein
LNSGQKWPKQATAGGHFFRLGLQSSAGGAGTADDFVHIPTARRFGLLSMQHGATCRLETRRKRSLLMVEANALFASQAR